ncbi:hypothetical protein AUJ78_01040 [Candidatus Peregrinibacteria bacterium CG1_02_41_10]|nr:MAG: hypothetical protein AUJ78_01040 [Candidatus Peregrinibacteria bacterium CG1_02_41_10]
MLKLKNILLLLILGCACSTLFSQASAAETSTEIKQQLEQYQQLLQQKSGSEKEYTRLELIRNRRDLEKYYENFNLSQNKIQDYDQILQQTQLGLTDLKSQLNYLAEQLNSTQYQIGLIEKKITEQESLLAQNTAQKDQIQIEFKLRQKTLVQFLDLLLHHPTLFPLKTQPSLFALKTIPLFPTDPQELLLKTYFSPLKKLWFIQTKLAEREKALLKTHAELLVLQDLFQISQQNLTDQLQAKKQLARETQGRESQYQALLKQARLEQQLSAEEITRIQSRLVGVEEKLAAFKTTQAESKPLQDSSKEQQLARFNWPVNPYLGLSAYFKDQKYQAIFGMEHLAIDIPTLQGTPLLAPDDGYVVKVRPGGVNEYSFLVLAHLDNFQTVYGHLSQILVKEGQLIKAGETIALSGGTPGTVGAGLITTGPHLHFEMIKDSQHVDPLDHLNVFQLPTEFIPERFLKP